MAVKNFNWENFDEEILEGFKFDFGVMHGIDHLKKLAEKCGKPNV